VKRRAILGLGGLLLLVVAGGAWLYGRGDQNLTPAKAAAALQARLHTEYRFRCETEHNDGTIALAGVDYACLPVGHPQGFGYWIATNAHGITGLLPSG
jgi:hypothetical protein